MYCIWVPRVICRNVYSRSFFLFDFGIGPQELSMIHIIALHRPNVMYIRTDY